MKKLLTGLKRVMIFVVITVVLLFAGAYSVMWICVNGPSSLARDLFVLSVRESSAGGFLADIYVSQSEIEEIENRNKVQVTDEITDTSQIIINNEKDNDENNTPDTGNEENSDDKKEEFQDGVRVEEVVGATYKGTMMIIQDPSRVFVGALKEYGEDKRGKNILEFIDMYGAAGGTNAGGFHDINGTGNGGVPEGLVISQGELKWGELDEAYDVIGMNKDNVLVVGKMTAQKALDMNVRDAVTFGPILVINGNPTIVGGTGGGLNPRTAIGQRKDGAILLLVIDGRQTASLGANMKDLMNVMLEYGAINAANLDGGSSTVMYYKGESLNTCASFIGMRDISTAILIKGYGE